MTTAESTDPTTVTTRTSRWSPRLVATDLSLVAAFAALLVAVTLVGGIPVGAAGVPITLQTFGVLIAGCVLGPVRGFLAVALYLVLGAVGLPVLANHTGGLASFTSASAGYLYAFPIAALLAGLLVKYAAGNRGKTHSLVVFVCAMAGTALVIHPLGILGLKLKLDLTWGQATTIDTPYWVGDILKAAVVALVAAEVHRAFPQLLRGRR